MSAPHSTNQMQSELNDLNEALEAAGVYVAVEVRDGNLILSGEVDSPEMHGAALDLAGKVAERFGLTVEDAIDVLEIGIEFGSGTDRDIESPVADRSTLSDVGTNYIEQASEEAIPYFAPTDPVFDNRFVLADDVEIVGGFQSTSMQGDEDDGDNEAERGDEQITDDVRRELREDSLTTDLEIQVRTRNGIVFLTGEVPSMDDAENAEEVANRVSGVREVREDLTIRDLMIDRER